MFYLLDSVFLKSTSTFYCTLKKIAFKRKPSSFSSVFETISESSNTLQKFCLGTFRMDFWVWKTPRPDFTFSFLTLISLHLQVCIEQDYISLVSWGSWSDHEPVLGESESYRGVGWKGPLKII